MSESKLAEAVRRYLDARSRYDSAYPDEKFEIADEIAELGASLRSALSAHDSQPQGERARIAVAGDGERWAAAGVSGEDDADIMDRARNAFGRYYGENSAPLCFIEATLPPRQPVPTVEGRVVE